MYYEFNSQTLIRYVLKFFIFHRTVCKITVKKKTTQKSKYKCTMNVWGIKRVVSY